VAIIRPAIEAAFCSAVRMTFIESMIPPSISIMSPHSLVALELELAEHSSLSFVSVSVKAPRLITATPSQ